MACRGIVLGLQCISFLSRREVKKAAGVRCSTFNMPAAQPTEIAVHMLSPVTIMVLRHALHSTQYTSTDMVPQCELFPAL